MRLVGASKVFLNNNFHALSHKDYRYFWFGQCISLIGTWAQNIGQSWLVLTLTDSPLLLGLVATMQFLPVMLFSLFAGIMIDKYPKKKIIIVTQTIAMILAFIMAALVFSHTIRYWHILILAFLLGLSNTVDMPTRQAFNIEIVGKEDLMNAISLNSATFNLARILGPAIGALLMAYVGPGWCFLINGFSFMAVIYGLIKIESKSYVRVKKLGSNIFMEIKDGIKYIMRTPLLFQTILMVTIVGIFVFNFNVLIPVYTKQILHMSEKEYGFLLSSLGIGSLIGALIASIRSKKGPKKVIMISSAILVSVMLMLVGLSKMFYGAAIFLAFTGVFNIMFSTTANSTIQMQAKDEYRGRVMSIYTLVFTGTAPIGSMFSGFLSDRFGADRTFIICGILTLVLISVLTYGFRLYNKKIQATVQ